MSARKFILFDLDGTLIDGVDDLVAAMNTVLRGRGLPPLQRAQLEAMLGDGVRMLTRRALVANAVQLGDAEFNVVCAEFLASYKNTLYIHTRLFRGVEATLRRLHADGWKIGLASNKPTEPCNSILMRLGVHALFATVAGGDATVVKKPDPAHLRYALEQMGWQPGKGDIAVMVGDHANDVDAARELGIPAIAVAFETDATHARALGAAAVLTQFAELPSALDVLVARYYPTGGTPPTIESPAVGPEEK